MPDTLLEKDHPKIISAKFLSTVTKNRNFFKWPKLLYFKQNVPKFELYKHNDELFNICTNRLKENFTEKHGIYVKLLLAM
jgi:hypothetical protein